MRVMFVIGLLLCGCQSAPQGEYAQDNRSYTAEGFMQGSRALSQPLQTSPSPVSCRTMMLSNGNSTTTCY